MRPYETAGKAVVHYLNEHPQAKDGRRLAALLDEIHGVMSLYASLGRLPEPDRAKRFQALKNAIRKIGHEWLAIAGSPTLFGLDFSGGRRRLVFTYDWGEAAARTPLLGKRGFLWTLAQEGFLHRVRRCLYCGRWLFAVKESQKCCSTRCRMAMHKSSPEYKRKHREHMRELRRHEKARRLSRPGNSGPKKRRR